MMNNESVYCFVFSKQAKLVNFIPTVWNCFQNRRDKLPGNILAIVTVLTAVSLIHWLQANPVYAIVYKCTVHLFLYEH